MTKTKVEPRQIYDVDFEDQKIETVMGDDGEKYVVVKRICQNLGIDEWRQQQRLQDDPDFNCQLMSVVAQDGKNRDMACLPLSQYYGWLMMINSKKVKSEIRPLLSAYRKRSIQVLNDFWTTGLAIATQDDCKLINELQDALVTIKDLETQNAELTADKKNLVIIASKKNNYIKRKDEEFANISLEIMNINNENQSLKNENNNLKSFYESKIINIYNEGNMLLAAKDNIIKYKDDIIKQYQIITSSGFNF